MNPSRGRTVRVTGYSSTSHVPFSPTIGTVNHDHVVNIGSTTGHLVYPRGNAYNATKFAQRNAYVVPKEEN